jgi:hypothetical protein
MPRTLAIAGIGHRPPAQREELGLSGDRSGSVVAWAIDALMLEIERGNPPPVGRSTSS